MSKLTPGGDQSACAQSTVGLLHIVTAMRDHLRLPPLISEPATTRLYAVMVALMGCAPQPAERERSAADRRVGYHSKALQCGAVSYASEDIC